jgi:cytochrome c
MKSALLVALGLISLTGFAAPAAAADVVKGRQVFNRCMVCHSNQPDVARVGPSLFGVYGRAPGTLASFRGYSQAMRAFGEGKIWDEATLDTYLANPRATVPGNRMAFPGVPEAGERADLIAFLKTLKGK